MTLKEVIEQVRCLLRRVAAIETNGGGGGGGSGTVTTLSVTTANGVSGSVANPTTTPAITLTLGNIAPASVAAVGTVTASNLSGVNTGDQINITGNAGTVTTNANLTGIVTSVGNATSIADGAIAISKLATNPRKVVVKVTAANYVAGTTNADELYGGIIYVTAGAIITLPPALDGMSVTVVTIGNVGVSVDPNAADLIVLDGVALSDGDKITNLSTAGDVAVLTYYNATGWFASTNGWADTN